MNELTEAIIHITVVIVCFWVGVWVGIREERKMNEPKKDPEKKSKEFLKRRLQEHLEMAKRFQLQSLIKVYTEMLEELDKDE